MSSLRAEKEEFYKTIRLLSEEMQEKLFLMMNYIAEDNDAKHHLEDLGKKIHELNIADFEDYIIQITRQNQ